MILACTIDDAIPAHALHCGPHEEPDREMIHGVHAYLIKYIREATAPKTYLLSILANVHASWARCVATTDKSSRSAGPQINPPDRLAYQVAALVLPSDRPAQELTYDSASGGLRCVM